ncbi:MAG: hypothetical protein ABSB35_23935 [Bryobacteraceae bacterium]
MPFGRACAVSLLASVLALALPAGAQSVISAHSGVIYYFEGSVYLGDQRLEPHLGVFPSLPQGSQLRTADGRAEVLLTPGVFIRMGENSSIRMVSNRLADTQVELQSGSAIVDSGEPNSGTSVSLIYKDWKVHFLEKGVYRMDCDPPHLVVRQGHAEVFAKAGTQPVFVEHGMNLPFAGVLVPDRTDDRSLDALSDWSAGRGQSIVADNTITAQLDEDPASQTAALDNFTYYPVLGMPSAGMGFNPYGYSSFQPGFNSLYLPGYTYQPMLLGLIGRGGFRSYVPSTTPFRTGTFTGARPIGGPSMGYRPLSPPVARPPLPSAPHVGGVHVGAHR